MRLEISPNTERALTLPRPRLRGVTHVVAFVLSVPGAVWLAAQAAPGPERAAVGVYGASMAVMFGISSLLHRRVWSEQGYEVMFRLDHSGIFVAFGGSATAVAVLGLEGWPAAVLLWGMWAAVGSGIAVAWFPFRIPRGAATTVYLSLGSLALPFVPGFAARNGWLPTVLLLGGGACYTVGAVIVALRRPDPSPRWFGYHELFHALVIAAVAQHAAMIHHLAVA